MNHQESLLRVYICCQLQVFMIEDLQDTELYFNELKMISKRLVSHIESRHGKNIADLWKIDHDGESEIIKDYIAKFRDMVYEAARVDLSSMDSAINALRGIANGDFTVEFEHQEK